jgi:hypothetical protein
MLNANVTLPFATVDTISLNLNPYAPIPKTINNFDDCSVYQTSISLDTSGNKFFDQQITNYSMYLMFAFNYDSEIVSKAAFNNENSETSNFLDE